MTSETVLLNALPVAVYTTDAEGRITFYNDAAATLWGCSPELGTAQWCGSWRLYWQDGRPMRHDECPMAKAVKEGRAVTGEEAIIEKPDGTRVPFMPFSTPLKDASGQTIGALNLLVDISERKEAELASARLAAIVSSSDDAIVSKTREGIITSWNAGATRIFGYEADEIVGKNITRIVPLELHQEEEEILGKLRRGERVDHFDTVRVTKDGRRIDVSLTISPVCDNAGRVIGASKVARDISERKRSEEMQRLLLDELNHRVKNTLAVIQAIASQSLHKAASPNDFVESFNGRIQALSRAHNLLVQGKMKGADVTEIVCEQVVFGGFDHSRVSCSGPFATLEARVAVQLALVLHELATNARKYGALSIPSGRLSISWKVRQRAGRELCLNWVESGVSNLAVPTVSGFGMKLIQRSLEANGGEADLRYDVDGVVCNIRLPLLEFDNHTHAADEVFGRAAQADSSAGRKAGSLALEGKRILLIEDEPLVAMDVEAQLMALGVEVIGPAGTIQMAHRLIAESSPDAALVDANLGGYSVEDIALALTRKHVPFAFATGYGREALPAEFRALPVLAKPFNSRQLCEVIEELLKNATHSNVARIRPARV